MEGFDTDPARLQRIVPPYQFDVDCRRELHNLELIDEQIAALERVLPACQAMITDDPPLLTVRKKLQDLEKAGRLLANATCNSPAAVEVMWRLQKASYEGGVDCTEIERACNLLLPLVRLASGSVLTLDTHPGLGLMAAKEQASRPAGTKLAALDPPPCAGATKRAARESSV
jgi:hypothetical protein